MQKYLIICLLVLAACSPQIEEQSFKEEKGLKIALLQIVGKDYDIEGNKIKGIEYCKKAAEQGADIALFPEAWSINYPWINPDYPISSDSLSYFAIDSSSAFIKEFQATAKSLNMAIGITYLEKTENGPRNSISLIDRNGHIRYTYAKIHTCDFGVFEGLTYPGDDFYVTELDTRLGMIKVGSMVCYDREQPESARILMLKGAEIVLVPNACILDELRLDQFKTRAFENATAFFMTNFAKPHQNGQSIGFNAEGAQLTPLSEEEEIIMAEINLDSLRAYRTDNWMVWGNSYRRPHKYQQLIDLGVDSIFRRTDIFGKLFVREER